MKRMITVITAAILLTACADTPKTVAGSSESKESVSEIESSVTSDTIRQEDVIPERIEVSQLKASDPDAAARIKSRSYGNLKFAETFSVNAADAPDLGVCDAEKKASFGQDAEKIIAAYFGDEFDRSKTEKSSDPKSPVVAAYELNGRRLMITPTSFCIQNTAMPDAHRTFSSGDKLVRQFEVTPAFSDEKLTLGNGEAKVSEMADMNKNFFDRLAACGYDYRPFTVSAMRSVQNGDSQQPAVVMIYNEYFKGLPVFNLLYTSYNGEKLDFNYSLIGCNDAVFADRDSIDSIIVNAPYGEVGQVSKADSIVSPDRAAELVSNALAEYLDLTALRLDLVYVPIFPDGAADNTKVTMTPYWLMPFGLQPMKEHYALVNAQTGQVTYFEPKGV